MEDLVIIIPVHKFDEEVNVLLKRAIDSVPNQIKIRLSCPKTISADVEGFKTSERIELYLSDGADDFATLVNQAVGGTKWFSILEYDDEYTSIWFDNFTKYVQFKPEVSVFMPMTDLINFNDNQYIGFGNEAPWASSFSAEIGYIDNESLQNYFDFYLTGSIFNTSDWEEVGGIKPSMKVSFWYELMLRWTNKQKQFFVIPKVGYKHYVNRVGSLYDIYRQEVTEDESAWWFDTAKKECFYKKDRNKTYKTDTKGE